jgi:SNF2 family DNA or RNA helicase
MTNDLFPYQVEGAAFLASKQRAGLFDEMGVGKTCQVIRAIDNLGLLRGIVVCPAVARENWRGEFKKFGRRPLRVCKGVTIHDFIAWQNGRFDVLVTSYEMMTKWAKHLDAATEVVDFIVFDEAHMMKDVETARAKALLGNEHSSGKGILSWGLYAWWLTGTPIPNDPADIYSFLRFTGAMPLKRTAFISRYFDSKTRTYSSVQTPKKELLTELQTFIGNNSIRRSLVQTGIQLPPIFTTTTLVDGDSSAVRDLLLAHPGLDEAIRQALESGRGLGGIDSDHVATLRRLIGEAKSLPYAQMLYHELKSGLDKIVVFGIHRVTLENVQKFLWQHEIDVRLINGSTSENDRQRHMQDFQKKPECRVLLGNLKAAGTALTLTASAALDLLESDWTPAGNAQAIKRVHRISQTRSVRARFITLADSFDEIVNEIVAEKTAKISLMEAVAA